MGSTAPRAGDDAARIRAMDAEFIANFRGGDAVELVNGFYADDAMVLPPDKPAIHGRQAITDFWRAMLASGASDLRMNTTQIEASGDLAYAVGEFTMSTQGRTLRGKYTVVYRRQAGGDWKAKVDMFSPNE